MAGSAPAGRRGAPEGCQRAETARLRVRLPLRTFTITFGAFFRRLGDRSRTVTLPVPDRVVHFLEPASRAVPVSLAVLELGGRALIVQAIVLPSAIRSQVTRTLGASPLSPLSPSAPLPRGRRPGGRAPGPPPGRRSPPPDRWRPRDPPDPRSAPPIRTA